MLFKQIIIPRVVIPYTSNTQNRLSIIAPLAAFSLVFKQKSYFNITLRPLGVLGCGVGGKFNFSWCSHPLGKGLFYSTSPLQGKSARASRKNISKSSDFFQKVYSDKSANNPFFIVDNFIKQYPNPELAKANIDYKLINTILSNKIQDFNLSKEAFDLLMKLIDNQPLKFNELPLSKEGKANFQNMLGVTKRGLNSKAGVYIFINKITGESYVGSSIALASRIKDDYLRKGKVLGKRPIESAIKKYGLNNFKLEIYVLSQELLNKIYLELHTLLTPEGEVKGILPSDILNMTFSIHMDEGATEFRKKIRNLVLILEQIIILLLNPKYNKLKVAGSAVGNKIQKELMESVFKKTRKTTYLYDVEKKELIYQTNSRTLLAEAMGMKRRLVPKQLYLNRFLISDNLLNEEEYYNNLLSAKALTTLISEIRDQIMAKTSQNFIPYKDVVIPSGDSEKLSKSTEIINTVTKEEKVFPSLNAAAIYLRELNSEYKASAGSLHNIMRRGGLYKGIFLVRYLVKE